MYAVIGAGPMGLAAARTLQKHGLDFVGDIVSAAFNQAQDVAERRRLAAEAAAPAPIRRPVVADEDAPAEDTGWVVRFLTNPLAVGVTLYLVLALVGARAAIGHVSGGALSPAPTSAQALMHLHTEAWHALLQGTPDQPLKFQGHRVVPLERVGPRLIHGLEHALQGLHVGLVPVHPAGDAGVDDRTHRPPPVSGGVGDRSIVPGGSTALAQCHWSCIGDQNPRVTTVSSV